MDEGQIYHLVATSPKILGHERVRLTHFHSMFSSKTSLIFSKIYNH